MITGSCLCGGVKFAIRKTSGPFEICHCNRCRKSSGSSSLAAITVQADDYALLEGAELVHSYAAPILYAEPAYEAHFCRNCGSPVPGTDTQREFVEVPAGLLENDPGIKPDKHIFIEFLPSWDSISDDLPQFTIRDLVRERGSQELPVDFVTKSHYNSTPTDG